MYMDRNRPDLGAAEWSLPSRCAACGVRMASLCGGISAGALEALHRIGRKRVLRRGEALIWQGDIAEQVGILHHGLVKLSASLEDGREQMLGLAFPADFVGAIGDRPSSHCVTALTETELCVFPRSALPGLVEAHPDVGQALLTRAYDELDQLRKWMLLLGRKSAEERVASLLLQFAARGTCSPGAPVALPLTRQQMAELLGLTIETVSRKLTAMKRDGVIALPDLRSFVILDATALAVLAAETP
ncbi:CRP/FNR family transcriptional regulator, anaerobic regulatory protein [Sphingomonas sp. NFR04]|uniref:Crp/Fnr family transcriptional regulator n=1 Tax=Sphingomonas sp. NFR04 TaxID=1566283 RepID=UPI0008E078B1|nr:Crp/Fnr family transcriptional regulator [Sphingomonas sp. NFR04]SFI99353.1 CRP/FNR family transcriptional regulator, anaerobic regulatory protein [Sphingomonas sp. NFR04]